MASFFIHSKQAKDLGTQIIMSRYALHTVPFYVHFKFPQELNKDKLDMAGHSVCSNISMVACFEA